MRGAVKTFGEEIGTFEAHVESEEGEAQEEINDKKLSDSEAKILMEFLDGILQLETSKK